eukprot:gene1192-563_t
MRVKSSECPELVQTDCGTENGILAAVQCTFRNDVTGHRYGSSPSNQRIENWWSHCKRGYSAWVIEYFKDLVASGKLILGSHFHMECAWHSAVGGVPDELFFLPESKGYSECGHAGLQHPPRDWAEAKAVFTTIVEIANC